MNQETALAVRPAIETADELITDLQTPKVKASNIRFGVNPRQFFCPVAMADLAENMKAVGVIEPLIIRPWDDTTYQLIAGERRLRCILSTFGPDYMVPVDIKDVDDEQAAAIALAENKFREPVSASEEAETAARLLGELGGDRDEAARRLGWKRQMLDARLALMNCADDVRQALSHRKILLGHAEILATMPKANQSVTLGRLLELEKLPSVNDFKAGLASKSKLLGKAIFDKKACEGCHHNSDQQRAMFEDALESGFCTNGQCFDDKTDEQLKLIVEKHKADAPRVDVVRPGENYTVIRLVAEGPKGVGASQAASCRACKDYGVAVMGTPDAMGKVITDACFNTVCNAKMVGKQLRAATATASESKPQQGSATKKVAAQGKQVAAASGKTTAPAPATTVVVTGQVDEYRKQLWRDALQAEVRSAPAKGLGMLIAGMLAGGASNISSYELGKAINAAASSAPLATDSSRKLEEVLPWVAAATDLERRVFTLEIVAQMIPKFGDPNVVAALRFFAVDLTKHFKLSEEFLNKLTKSEIEVLIRDIGLDAHLGDLKKLLSQKKPAIVKEVLAVPGFDYSTVPSFLLPQA